MNMIKPVKAQWKTPTLRRVPLTEAIRAEILAQAEAKSSAARRG